MSQNERIPSCQPLEGAEVDCSKVLHLTRAHDQARHEKELLQSIGHICDAATAEAKELAAKRDLDALMATEKHGSV